MATTKFRLAALRVNKGLSQSEMANKLGVTTATVSNWERGKRMNLSNLVRIANFFEVPLDDIDLTDFMDNR